MADETLRMTARQNIADETTGMADETLRIADTKSQE